MVRASGQAINPPKIKMETLINDISVIRSVRSKVSRKEEVDLRRLQIIDKALDKLKKFKVEYD